MNKTVIQMVEAYLAENGWDGLYSDECGCELADLAPCGEIQGDCRAGKKHVITSQDIANGRYDYFADPPSADDVGRYWVMRGDD